MEEPDLILMQETKVPQYWQEELASEFKDFKLTLNAEDAYLGDILDKVRATTKTQQGGTGVLAANKLGETGIKMSHTHRFHEVSMGDICIINAYLPCDGAGPVRQEEFRQTVSDIGEYLESNAGNRKIIVVGDLNCSRLQQKRSRWQSLESLMSKFNLKPVIPDFTTNYHHNMRETTIDFLMCSREITIKNVRGLTRDTLPGNTSTHIPVIYDIEYEEMVKNPGEENRVAENQHEEQGHKLYERKRRPNWLKKMDKRLYKKLEEIYCRVSFRLTEGMPAPWRIKLLEDMLSVAASKAEIRTGRTQIQESKTKEMKKIMRRVQHLQNRLDQLVHRAYGPDWALVPVQELLEMGPGHTSGRNGDIQRTMEELYTTLQRLRDEQKREWDKENTDKNEEIMKAMRDNDFKAFFEKVKVKDKQNEEGTNEIIYEGKRYTGKDILKAYVLHAKKQSQDPRTVPGCKIDWKFVTKRQIYLMKKFLAEQDTRNLRHLNEDTYQNLLSSLKKNKASDIYNCQLEHLLHASTNTSVYMVELLNQILDEPQMFAHTAISRSLASMLHKGKGRPKDDIGNYRRIQISTLAQKLLQKVIINPAGEMTKHSMVPTQWGFTSNVSFLTATFVRETLTKLAYDNDTVIYLIASDIESAFSRTERILQMYELARQGEAGKILLFSHYFYQNTDVVMSSGPEFSALFQEQRGAAQGSLLAPNHFKSYSVPLYQLLKNSGLGIKVADEDWSCLAVADDHITVTDSKVKFKHVSDIYQNYSYDYGVIFSFKKTHINIYGRNQRKDHAEELEFGGCELTVSHESEHLGLKVLQNPAQTVSRNVENRISKANKKLFKVMGRTFRRRYPMAPEVSRTMINSIVSPMLGSGLQALCINITSMKRVQRAQNISLRRSYAVGKISPHSPLALIMSVLPMEGHIHYQALSLFHNIAGLPGPARNLLIHLFSNKSLRQYHWSMFLNDICKQYSLPDPAVIVQLPHIKKKRWANIVKPRIVDYQEKLLQQKMNSSSMYPYVFPGDFSLKRKKMHPIMTAAKTNKQILAMQFSLRHLLMEAPVAHNLHRKKLIPSPLCRHCDIKSESDTSEHMMTTCKLTRESPAARDARMQLFEQLHIATGVSLNTLLTEFWSDSRKMIVTILNPTSNGADSVLHIEEDNPHLSQVILSCQYLVLTLTALRFQQDVRPIPRRPGRKPGGNSGNHPRPPPKGPKGKQGYTELKRTYERNTLFQTSTKPGEHDDIRFSASKKKRGSDIYIASRSSILASIQGPGLIPIFISGPGEGNYRKMKMRTFIWASHDGESYNKALNFYTSYEEIGQNLQFVLIEAFNSGEAEKIAAIAPLQLKAPNGEGEVCPNTITPVLLVISTHDLIIRSWLLDESDDMMTVIVAPKVQPLRRFPSLLSQLYDELSELDQTTYNIQGRELPSSWPIEDIGIWLTASLDPHNWTIIKMSDPTTNWGEMAWKIGLALLEWCDTGKVRRIEAQSKFQKPGDIGAHHADKLTSTVAGHQRLIMQPVEFINRIITARAAGYTLDSISPIRNGHNSGTSRMSSTPSVPTSATRTDQTLETKVDNLATMVQSLLKGSARKKLYTSQLDTTSENDVSMDFKGRHAGSIRALQLKNEEMKRKRQNCCKYPQKIGNKRGINILFLATMADGPNGTITISSGEDNDQTSNLVIELDGDNRVVTKETRDDSMIRIPSVDSSPELREGHAAPGTSKEPSSCKEKPTKKINLTSTLKLQDTELAWAEIHARAKARGERYDEELRTQMSEPNDNPPREDNSDSIKLEDTEMAWADIHRRADEMDERIRRELLTPAATAADDDAKKENSEMFDTKKIWENIHARETHTRSNEASESTSTDTQEDDEDKAPERQQIVFAAENDEAMRSFVRDLEATGAPEQVFQALMQQLHSSGQSVHFVHGPRDPTTSESTTPPSSATPSATPSRDPRLRAGNVFFPKLAEVKIKQEDADNNNSSSSNSTGAADTSGASALEEKSPGIITETPNTARQGSIRPPGAFKNLKMGGIATARNFSRMERMAEDQYREKLRDGQFEDEDMSMLLTPEKVTKQVMGNTPPRATNPNYVIFQEESSSDDSVKITCHVDSEEFMRKSIEEKGEKSKKGKSKFRDRPRSVKIEATDRYKIVEQGTLIGTATISKEARTSTKEGEVRMIPVTPENPSRDTTLDTTREEPVNYPDDTITFVKGRGKKTGTDAKKNTKESKKTKKERKEPEAEDPLMRQIDEQLADYNRSPLTGTTVVHNVKVNNAHFLNRYRTRFPGPREEGVSGVAPPSDFNRYNAKCMKIDQNDSNACCYVCHTEAINMPPCDNVFMNHEMNINHCKTRPGITVGKELTESMTASIGKENCKVRNYKDEILRLHRVSKKAGTHETQASHYPNTNRELPRPPTPTTPTHPPALVHPNLVSFIHLIFICSSFYHNLISVLSPMLSLLPRAGQHKQRPLAGGYHSNFPGS